MTIRRVPAALLAVYFVFLVLALFSPASDQQNGMVEWVGLVLDELGFPAAITTSDRLEVAMNAVIITPVTFLAGLVWTRPGWRDWTAFGFVGSVLVELTQELVLPGRHAAFSDVVANTAGALAGAVLIGALTSVQSLGSNLADVGKEGSVTAMRALAPPAEGDAVRSRIGNAPADPSDGPVERVSGTTWWNRARKLSRPRRRGLRA